MKNILILCLVTLLCSCSSIQNLSDYLPTKKENIPIALQEQVVAKINPETELFAVGNSKIDKTGSLLAQAKANKLAKEYLRDKIKAEVKNNLNIYLSESNLYTKGIVTPVIEQLSDYATELSLKNISQKGAWENSTEVYSLFAISRNEVATNSKQVFSNYLKEITNNLTNITDKMINN